MISDCTLSTRFNASIQISFLKQIKNDRKHFASGRSDSRIAIPVMQIDSNYAIKDVYRSSSLSCSAVRFVSCSQSFFFLPPSMDMPERPPVSWSRARFLATFSRAMG